MFMRHQYTSKNEPIRIHLKARQSYRYCTCGKSDTQPLCDKYSHHGTSRTFLSFDVKKDGAYYLCNCKKSKHQPYCDGSHKE